MYIYKITCLVNNKVYIGQTSQTVKDRFRKHMGSHKDEHDTKFYRAVRKYGTESFIIEQIDTASTQQELDEKEVYWINYYDSVNKGYNMISTPGKRGGDTLSNHPNKKEISEKIRKSKIGDKNPMKDPKNSSKIRGSKNGMFGRTGGSNPWSRRIVVLDSNMKLYKVFDSLAEAKRNLNVTTTSMITLRCQGKTKSPYKGYYFKYYDDYINNKV